VRTAALREDLRERDVLLEAYGLTLHVDAPAGALTNELHTDLRENKHALIRQVERERRRLEEAASRGLVIKWAREPGYLFLHDPTTGQWHEVRASDCPPSVVESAKAHRRRRGQRR
jgi:TubC N-terminal docking domain